MLLFGAGGFSILKGDSVGSGVFGFVVCSALLFGAGKLFDAVGLVVTTAGGVGFDVVLMVGFEVGKTLGLTGTMENKRLVEEKLGPVDVVDWAETAGFWVRLLSVDEKLAPHREISANG